MHPTGNPLIVDRLVAKGMVSPEQREAALNQQNLVGGRIEEALLEVDAIAETALLKFLAAEHKTRFVSTDKLAKADISPATLALVSRKMADQETVFPVLHDEQHGVLSVVTPDVDNLELIRQVQLAAGVKQVRALVGRPLAVRAAIAKHYHGDIHAFAQLDRSAHEQFTQMLDVFERNLVTEESMVVSLAQNARNERLLSPDDFKAGGASSEMARRGIASQPYLQTLNILISLLENTRPDLRGHSAHVARLVALLCERIGLSGHQTAAYQIAAYVHDLGKMGSMHLTPLNVARSASHRAAAQKLHRGPLSILEAIELPSETKSAIAAMYERMDGRGVPGELTGKEIPLGARLLAIADTYADLAYSAANPLRKLLEPAQACEVLARYKGTIFDSNLVDLFRMTVAGEDLKARLLAQRHVVLLIEPDPEESTVLELRLIEQGFDVCLAREATSALKRLESGDISVVVSEIALGAHDGLAVLSEARQRLGGERTPWVFIADPAGRGSAQRAFELGALDFMTKPLSAELLVAKLKQIIEREARMVGGRGVAGSLNEMGLPEIVQVLWHGRKTGALKIRAGTQQGEIHFVDGAIYNALYETLRGEEAFYQMLALSNGEFLLDPSCKASHRVIEQSPEGLLLEGMRRVDEGIVR